MEQQSPVKMGLTHRKYTLGVEGIIHPPEKIGYCEYTWSSNPLDLSHDLKAQIHLVSSDIFLLFPTPVSVMTDILPKDQTLILPKFKQDSPEYSYGYRIRQNLGMLNRQLTVEHVGYKDGVEISSNTDFTDQQKSRQDLINLYLNPNRMNLIDLLYYTHAALRSSIHEHSCYSQTSDYRGNNLIEAIINETNKFTKARRIAIRRQRKLIRELEEQVRAA